MGLLEKLANPLIVPDAVATELLSGPIGDPARIAIEGKWGQRMLPTQMPEIVLEWGLGAEESSVITLCIENKPATGVLDDAAARSAARAIGVRVIGTLGVIIRGKHAGLLASAAAVITDLQKAGLFLDDAVVAAALEQVGE